MYKAFADGSLTPPHPSLRLLQFFQCVRFLSANSATPSAERFQMSTAAHLFRGHEQPNAYRCQKLLAREIAAVSSTARNFELLNLNLNWIEPTSCFLRANL